MPKREKRKKERKKIWWKEERNERGYRRPKREKGKKEKKTIGGGEWVGRRAQGREGGKEWGEEKGIAASPGNRVGPCLRDAVCSGIRKPLGNQEKQASQSLRPASDQATKQSSPLGPSGARAKMERRDRDRQIDRAARRVM